MKINEVICCILSVILLSLAPTVTAATTPEGIPIRTPDVPITDINTVPGLTAINLTTTQRIGLPGIVDSFVRTVTTALRFAIGEDGKPKTSESEFDREKEMFLGLFEPEWNGQGRLRGADGGGKLMPLSLAQSSLSWPVDKEGSLMTEKYVNSSGSYFGSPKDFECNTSPLMAETEPLKYDLPISLGGSFILGAIKGTQRTGGEPGIPTLNLGAPRQEWGIYNQAQNRIELKPELYGMFADCKAQSSSRKNLFNLFNIFGFLGFSGGGGSDGVSTGYGVAGGPNDIITEEDCSGAQCFFRYFSPLTTSTSVWIGSDGHPALYSSIIGGENIRNNAQTADSNVQDLADNYRGWVNTDLPLTILDNWKQRDYHDYGHAFTDLPQRAEYFVLGQPERELNFVTHAGTAAAKDGIIAGLCMYTPLSKQDDLFSQSGLSGQQKCNEVIEKKSSPPNVPNTSSWALTRTSPPSTFTPSGPFAQLLEQAARDSGVPQCVMEGVAQIEGGSRYEELPLDECLENTNSCSAVGSMQFTVGPGHGQATEEVCRSQCDAGYCPNAWARYGEGGNPCNYKDALTAAGRYLADYGHFGQDDLQESVHDAATAYYGSDDYETARNVLGGCEYWEYVYRHCNQSYVCRANR